MIGHQHDRHRAGGSADLDPAPAEDRGHCAGDDRGHQSGGRAHPRADAEAQGQGKCDQPDHQAGRQVRVGLACAQSERRGSSCLVRTRAPVPRATPCHLSGSGGQFGLELTLRSDDPRQDAPGCEKQVAHLWDADRVDHFAAMSLRDHQRRTTEHGELLGEVAGLDGDLLQQLVDGVVTLGEQLEDPDPGRMPEGLEELGLRLVQRNTHDPSIPWLAARVTRGST